MPARKLSSLLGTPEGLARAQGVFNIVGGAWPLVHRRSFEAFFGPKEDEWLQQTVGALLVAAGCSQVLAANSPEGHAHARRTGLGTAASLLAIDLLYVPAGRIRWTYLLDGAAEIAWIAAWLRAARKARSAATSAPSVPSHGRTGTGDVPAADRGTTAPGGRFPQSPEVRGAETGSPGSVAGDRIRTPLGRAPKGDVPVAGAGVGTARGGEEASRSEAPHMVTVAHVEQLLRTDDPGAALVAVGGRVEVVSSGESSGGLVVAEREDVLRTLPEGDRSPDALRRVARALDTAISELGG
ncbi:hypothetical protein [Actinocorallia libanotica]|uniref:Uncharacterized protein n=1 Tax=Actinocorallia libanotica TaxID=46162 RepID=A0ABP4AQ62_9ACTN